MLAEALVGPPPETLAWFVYVPEALPETLTFSVIVELAPAAIELDVVHEAVLTVHVQPFPLILVGVKTLGSVSVTVTVPLVAVELPLVTVIAYCPFPPAAKLPLCDRPMLQLPDWETWPLTPPQPPRAAARQITEKEKKVSLSCIMRRLPSVELPVKELPFELPFALGRTNCTLALGIGCNSEVQSS
jgi:hypothetical protein